MFSEISLMAWMSGAILFAIGGGAGFFLARQIKDKHTLGLEKQLEVTQNQLSEYQGEVNRHFLKTSLLFNKLTDDYREVYEHLATGAQKLCNDKPLPAALDLPETKILSAVAATGAAVAAVSATADEEPDADAAATPSVAEHDDVTRSDDETLVATDEPGTTATETAPAETAAQPADAVTEAAEHPTGQTAAESVATDPAETTDPVETTDPLDTKAASATETADDAPAITEEELKTLEASEQEKSDENIPLGAESVPSTELEHHKTHPSIH